MGFQYSDGKEVESHILGLVEKAQNLSSKTSIAPSEYHNWAVRYHLCPERANLLRHLNFKGLTILEIGAGMGAVSRHIAESAQSLHVVEGSPLRYQVLSSRLRDLSNWEGTIGNFQDVQLSKKFDVVCIIGVMEYSELYLQPQNGESPFQTFLNLAFSYLKPDGVLLIAIENKLGIKYWNGAPEDHTGNLFDGICGYSLSKSPKTFSRQELLTLLKNYGDTVEEYYPFPDYKVPSTVLKREFLDKAPETAAAMACSRPFESYGPKRLTAFPDLLAVKNVAQAGLLSEFANSFLFLVSREQDSPTYKQMTQDKSLAWHYSPQRQVPVQTFISEKSGKLVVDKKAEIQEKSYSLEGLGTIRWKTTENESLISGPNFRYELLNSGYFSSWETTLDTFEQFLRWSFSHWGPYSLDAVCTNAFRCTDGFQLFDLEWKADFEIPKTWFILRNLGCLGIDKDTLFMKAPVKTLKGIYELLCHRFQLIPQFDRDILYECRLQAAVTLETRVSVQEKHLRKLFGASTRPFLRSGSTKSLIKWAARQMEARLRRRLVFFPTESTAL